MGGDGMGGGSFVFFVLWFLVWIYTQLIYPLYTFIQRCLFLVFRVGLPKLMLNETDRTRYLG